jgi:hypothetical protein
MTTQTRPYRRNDYTEDVLMAMKLRDKHLADHEDQILNIAAWVPISLCLWGAILTACVVLWWLL